MLLLLSYLHRVARTESAKIGRRGSWKYYDVEFFHTSRIYEPVEDKISCRGRLAHFHSLSLTSEYAD